MRQTRILWTAAAILVVLNVGTWWHHYNVKEAYRNEVVDLMLDAYRRGAYTPGHPLYESCRRLDRQEHADAQETDEWKRMAATITLSQGDRVLGHVVVHRIPPEHDLDVRTTPDGLLTFDEAKQIAETLQNRFLETNSLR